MQTWIITVDEKEYSLRRDWELPAFLVVKNHMVLNPSSGRWRKPVSPFLRVGSRRGQARLWCILWLHNCLLFAPSAWFTFLFIYNWDKGAPSTVLCRSGLTSANRCTIVTAVKALVFVFVFVFVSECYGYSCCLPAASAGQAHPAFCANRKYLYCRKEYL